MSIESVHESVSVSCVRLEPDGIGIARVSDRQERIPGWDQEAEEGATLLIVGGGGIGSWIGMPSVKQGVGSIVITDPDTVEHSNLNRQLFTDEDLFKPKGPCLARNLARLGFLGTKLQGHPLYFSEFREEFPSFVPDIGVVGVDDDACRVEATKWFLQIKRPVLTIALSATANDAYVFVQEATGACLACFLGSQIAGDGKRPCPGTPASIDALLVVAGFASYAIGSLLMKRPRTWNLVKVSMATGTVRPMLVPKREGCGFCGSLVG